MTPPGDCRAGVRALYFFLPPCFPGLCETADPAMLLVVLELFGLLSAFAAFDATGFAEFAHTQLPDRVHQALIRNTHHDRLVGHLSRDSTAIEAR